MLINGVGTLADSGEADQRGLRPHLSEPSRDPEKVARSPGFKFSEQPNRNSNFHRKISFLFLFLKTLQFCV